MFNVKVFIHFSFLDFLMEEHVVIIIILFVFRKCVKPEPYLICRLTLYVLFK